MAEHDSYEFTEEEYTTQFNGRTVLRILAQTKPHWPWVVGFVLMITTVAALDSYFTFLSKRIIDEGILGRDLATVYRLVTVYAGLIFVQAGAVFGFIYLCGILGERIQRRKQWEHIWAERARGARRARHMRLRLRPARRTALRRSRSPPPAAISCATCT